ncbi:MAG: TonB-dependent receptor [Vicinamibacterales bacterium]
MGKHVEGVLVLRRRLPLAALAMLLAAGPLHAQTVSEGTVRGVVRDADGGVLPGVTVTATSPTVPGTHVGVTESDGQYRLLNLPPGTFDVVADLTGFTKYTQQGVEVRAGLNLTLDIVLTLASVQESIIVRADSPLLETQKPIQAVNVAGDFQRLLPLSTRRDLTDALEVTPGVTARNLIANNGTQTYMLRGTDVEQHVVLIDGADMASSRQGRMEIVRLPTNAIADSQVRTAGADASAPAGLGVVFNVTTRAGTNRLSGSAGVHHQNRGWNADNDPLGVPAIAETTNLEAAIGGPIRRDRAWFFASYFYLHRNSQISRTPTQWNNLRASIPGWEPFDNRSRHHTGFVKVNAQVGARHQLHGFFLKPHGFEEPSASTDSRRFSNSGTTGNGVAGRLFSAWTNTLTTTVGASFNTFGGRTSLAAFKGLDYGGPRVRIYDSATLSAGRLVGNGLVATVGNNQSFNVTPSSKVTVQADVNWYRTGWMGSHEFQAGVFMQPVMRLSTEANYLNGGFILEDVRLRVPGDPYSGYIPFHRQVVDPARLVFTTEKRNSENYAVYVQDSWKPVPRLTLVGGLRFDRVVDDDELFGVRTQSSLEVGPRVGAIYALTADSRNIVHGSFSRVAAKPEWLYLPTLGGGFFGGGVTVTTTDSYDTRGDGSFATVLVTPAQTQVAANRRVDPDRHQPFTDEILLGYRRQLPGQISLDATFIRRAYKDMPAQVDINGIYTDGVFRGYEDVSQNAILLQTNNVWNTPIYTGVEVIGSQRTRRSQFLVGYTRGFQHLDGTWQPNDPASFIQPSAFANNRGIGSIRGGESNSLSGTSQSRNPMWIKHALRLAGSYNAPWGLSLSSNLNVFSGPYTGPIVTLLAAPDPQFGPPTLVLSNGRTVSNPLATTVRFAYATRGEGQLQAPALAQWNARVGRRFALGGRTLDVAVSVLNITNRDALQEFLGGDGVNTGSNLIGSASFAYAPDGTFRGQNRQAARAAQLSLQVEF